MWPPNGNRSCAVSALDAGRRFGTLPTSSGRHVDPDAFADGIGEATVGNDRVAVPGICRPVSDCCVAAWGRDLLNGNNPVVMGHDRRVASLGGSLLLNAMIWVSPVALARFTVKKVTGGRLWNKPWGIPKLTKTQKRNRKKNKMHALRNIDILELAELREPKEYRLPFTPMPPNNPRRQT